MYPDVLLGVERGTIVLSSMPPTIEMRDDWLILDQVIDAPVYQDILTWDGLSQAIGLRSRFLGLFKVAYLTVLAKLKDVDYLLIAKPVAFNHLGIRRDCAMSLLTLPVIGSSL